MSFLDAAYQVLEKAKEPLRYREITRRALEQGLIQTKGKTPEATLRGQLGASIRRELEGGPPSPFRRAGRGIFGLAEWQHDVPTPPPSSPTPPSEPRRSYLSYKAAALQALKEAGQPLHYQEITHQAVEQELINPQGLTPEATMGAQLYTDIKRRGGESPFRREGRGTFGLAEWEKGVRGIVRQVTRQRREAKKQLLDTLREMGRL